MRQKATMRSTRVIPSVGLTSGDGPTAIPAGGWIGFHDLEQIADYELDYDLLAEKHVIDKVDNIYYGMGWDINELKKRKKVYSESSFSLM